MRRRCAQFEAISKFASEEKKVVKALLEDTILKHEANAGSSRYRVPNQERRLGYEVVFDESQITSFTVLTERVTL